MALTAAEHMGRMELIREVERLRKAIEAHRAAVLHVDATELDMGDADELLWAALDGTEER